MNKPLTKADLLDILAEYPDDTLIVDRKGYSLFAHHIDEVKLDDWSTSTITDDGEIPGVAIAVSIGK